MYYYNLLSDQCNYVNTTSVGLNLKRATPMELLTTNFVKTWNFTRVSNTSGSSLKLCRIDQALRVHAPFVFQFIHRAIITT